MAFRRAVAGVAAGAAGLGVYSTQRAHADEASVRFPGHTETAAEFKIPMLGFGTACLGDSASVEKAVLAALERGYRNIDTALLYRSQEGIAAALAKTDVPREEIFVTTKIAFYPRPGFLSKLFGYPSSLPKNVHNVKGDEKAAMAFCLKELKQSYVDLTLIHTPCTTWLELWTGFVPHYTGLMKIVPGFVSNLLVFLGSTACWVLGNGYEERKASWLAMEALKAEGATRAIGVSNYTVAQLEELKTYANEMPVVNQLEMHPLYPRKDVIAWCQKNNIAVTAYGHHVVFPALDSLPKEDLDFTATSPLLLKWIMEQGVTVVPRSKNPDHMAENAKVFGWKLTDAQKAVIKSIETNTPYYWNVEGVPTRK